MKVSMNASTRYNFGSIANQNKLSDIGQYNSMTQTLYNVKKDIKKQNFVIIPKFILDAYQQNGVVKMEIEFEKYQIRRLQKEIQLLKKLKEEQKITKQLQQDYKESQTELHQLQDDLKKKQEEKDRIEKERLLQQQKQQEQMQQAQQAQNAFTFTQQANTQPQKEQPTTTQQPVSSVKDINQQNKEETKNPFNSQQQSTASTQPINNPFNSQTNNSNLQTAPQNNPQIQNTQIFNFGNTEVKFGDRQQLQMPGQSFNINQTGFGQSNANNFGSFQSQAKPFEQFNSLATSKRNNMFEGLL